MAVRNNSTENIASSEGGEWKLSTIEYATVIQLIFVFVIGTFGNGFVVYFFGQTIRRNKKPFASFLFMLGIVDFVASLFVPSLFIYETFTKFSQWPFGYYGCKLIHGFFPITISMSSSILTLISVERCRVLVNPFCTNLSNGFISLWLLCSLVISIILDMPYLLALQVFVDGTHSKSYCAPDGRNLGRMFFFAIGNFVRDIATGTVMVTCGIISHFTLKSYFKNAARSHKTSRLKSIKKCRKMLVVLVVVFSSCVVPLDMFQIVMYLLRYKGYTLSSHEFQISMNINTYLIALQISNSATNVLIYSKMQKGFVRSIVSKCFCYSGAKSSEFRESIYSHTRV